MKTMVMAAQFSGVVFLVMLSACSGPTGGNSTRSRFKYDAVSASGTFTTSSQLAGSCTATANSTMTLGLGDYCSVTYSKKTAKLDGLVELTTDFAAATGTNSCGSGRCDTARTGKRSLSVGLRDALGENPQENASVVVKISGFSEQLNSCGASLAMPVEFEAQAFNLGTLMTDEFELIGSGQKSLTASTVEGTSSGTLDYNFRIKFRLQAE